MRLSSAYDDDDDDDDDLDASAFGGRNRLKSGVN
jgi:hypothetical protein